MAIIASKKGGSFEPIPAGSHAAVCYGVIALGTQYNEKFDNSSQKVMIQWELPNETIDFDGEEKRRVTSKMYTLSLNEKANLRKDLESWRGRQFTEEELLKFDLKNVLGTSCLLSIIHNDNGYANVSGVMSLPKGFKALKPENNTVYFDLTRPFDEIQADLILLPEWIQNIIEKSDEFKGMRKIADEGKINKSEKSKKDEIVGDEDSIPF